MGEEEEGSRAAEEGIEKAVPVQLFFNGDIRDLHNEVRMRAPSVKWIGVVAL